MVDHRLDAEFVRGGWRERFERCWLAWQAHLPRTPKSWDEHSREQFGLPGVVAYRYARAWRAYTRTRLRDGLSVTRDGWVYLGGLNQELAAYALRQAVGGDVLDEADLMSPVVWYEWKVLGRRISRLRAGTNCLRALDMLRREPLEDRRYWQALDLLSELAEDYYGKSAAAGP